MKSSIQTGALLGAILTAIVPAWAGTPGRLLGSSFGIPGRNATYDYVVVGGGTAGLTIATRLVQQKAGTVAVIEAGSFYELDNGNASQVPAADSSYITKNANDWQPLIDWGYQTVPQKGANNLRMHYARGKCFGGSSAWNYMAYQVGTTASYKQWADAAGDDTYQLGQFHKYFKKSINFAYPRSELRFANASPSYDVSAVADTSGPLALSFPNYAQAFATWTVRGLQELGMAVIPGFLGGRLLGQSYVMTTIDAAAGVRSTSEAFLRAALQDPQYTAYHRTMAKRILFDGNRTATGVLVDTAGLAYTISAAKEVIVSGGFVGSPQLLQASGVGPAALLSALDIPVVADRPGVGQGLQDHIYYTVSHRVNAPTTSALYADPAFAAQQAAEHARTGGGMYSNPITEVIGWEKVPEPLRSQTLPSGGGGVRAALDAYPADWPELEYISASGFVGFQNATNSSLGADGHNYASLAVVLITPRSRGSVNITSPDTAVHPAIDPNFLADPADVAVALAGFKRARQFWGTKAMAPFKIGDEYFPGNGTQSDAEIEAFIREAFNTIFHGSCTCAMGKRSDTNAVVDSEARVIGFQGLRVVDAADFPFLPPGHPQSTIYALAETRDSLRYFEELR